MISTSASSSSRVLAGVLFGLATVSIWGAWMVVMRLGVNTTLSPADITALRFATAGALLAPVVVKRGLGLDKLGWGGLSLLVLGAGAPYVLLVGTGLRWAPAAQGGVLVPGVLPLFVAVLAFFVFKERFGKTRMLGYALIVLGIFCVLGLTILHPTGNALIGQCLFLCAALSWATFTIVMRKSKIEPVHAVALVAVGSAVWFLPVYVGLYGFKAFHAPLSDVVFQAVFQGIVVTIISGFLYAKAIHLLGASAGSAFVALAPVLSALLGIPILHEYPGASDWAGVAAVALGVYLASGGPLNPAKLRRKRPPP